MKAEFLAGKKKKKKTILGIDASLKPTHEFAYFSCSLQTLAS